jgi:hypothetical protein
MRRQRTIAIEAGAANAVARIEAALFTQDQAADPQTGVGAGDEEESGAIGVANADIFDRRDPRQIGGSFMSNPLGKDPIRIRESHAARAAFACQACARYENSIFIKFI